MAFEFVGSEQPELHSVIVSKATGEMYYQSELGGDFDEIPEEAYESEDYVEIPHKNDLDLDQRLVWRFVEKEIPGLESKVRDFFSKRGAYAKYKALLTESELLDKWYEFENSETQKALRGWCEANGIETDG